MNNNNNILVKEYFHWKVINIQYSNSANGKDIFLFQAAKLLSKKGFEIIKRSY